MTRQERKIVTIVFVDIVGFTSRAEQMDPEDVAAVLAPYHARLRTELERYGGTVEKFIGDAVMALFGAPVAHEDDPERAVRAALAIRDWVLEEGGLEVRIGVNTGEALITLGARPAEGEGMAAGDVVNTAARLQSAAPVNGILVGETTYRATERGIDYRPAAPVEAKGKAEPVTVWEVEAARSRFGEDVQRETRTALVGRRRELDQLADALARARQECEPQLVTLVGVPGIGKSRLILELFRLVDADPDLIWWRQGRSLPYGEGIAYWALGEIVKAQAGILETDTADEAGEKLRRAVADFVEPADAHWVEAHVRPLVGLGGDQGGGEDRRSEAFAAWRRFLEVLAEANPLVLVFEDLQWADEGLLDFIDYLLDWASGVPLLVVCSGRPELLERRPGWGGGQRNAATVSLSPLSSEDTARLVAALLEQAVLPAELQQTLLARAEGNPLYAEEYARVLLERGSEKDLPLPETVQGLIAARLDALSREEKELVQDAAVVGKVFWSGALGSVGDLPLDDVEERLHALERKEFVRRERRGSVAGETQYAFLHVLVRDVAYGQIPRARRAETHRLAAEWIASLASDRAEDHAEMLAHHYLEAIELTEAAGLDPAPLADPARLALRDAGERAHSLAAIGAADRYLRAAIRLWPADDPERPRLLFDAGRSRGDFLDADVELLTEAAAGLLELGDRETAGEAEVQIALAYWARAERDRAYEHMDRAVSFVADAPPSPAKAGVLSWRAALFMLAGDTEEAIRRGREALALADALELDEIRSNSLNTIGSARVAGGDPAGVDELEHALEIARRINSPTMVQRGLNNLANMYWHLGRLAEASDLIAELRTHGEHFGLAAMLSWTVGEEAADRFLTGRWEEAARLASAFIEDTTSSHYLEASARGHRAMVFLARGDLASADADTQRALELARQAQDLQIRAPAIIQRAEVALALGRRSEASALLDELLAIREGRIDFVTNVNLTLLAWVVRSERRAEEFVSAFERVLPSPWRDAARAIAEDDLVAAAEIFAGIGARGEEARARLAAADQLVAEGRRAEADEQLHRALAFFREAGATAYLRQGEALLAATA